MKRTLKNSIHMIEKNKDITLLSNYKTPARADYFYEIISETQLPELYEVLHYADQEQLKILWVSWGTNMLFAFDVYNGIVIKNSLKWWTYNIQTKFLHAYSSDSIWDIAEDLEKDYGQNIWHRFIGLPGSIAWAIYWNAGCFWLETENNFVSCKIMNMDNGEVQEMNKSHMNFSYRNSYLKEEKKYFIVSAIFDLNHKIEKYHSDIDNIDFRQNKQPKWNSCGSFFKNPSKESTAGYLIEQVWLKGYKIGGAVFSHEHANFLIHNGSWTYKDLIDLIKLAQTKVEESFWILLENEVQIITNSSCYDR